MKIHLQNQIVPHKSKQQHTKPPFSKTKQNMQRNFRLRSLLVQLLFYTALVLAFASQMGIPLMANAGDCCNCDHCCGSSYVSSCAECPCAAAALLPKALPFANKLMSENKLSERRI